MAKNTLKVALRGEVILTEFAETMEHFSALIQALTNEIAGPVDVTWQVSRLEAGSAVAEVVGHSVEAEMVEKVVFAYSTVAKSLEDRVPIPYSYEVEKEARALVGVINGRIHSVELSTDDVSTIVKAAWKEEEVTNLVSLSAVEGTVETLSSRHGVRFILYDTLFDKAIYCYIEEKQREMLRSAWGKRVVVLGRVRRDPRTGRPIEIRDIRSITIKEPLPKRSYKRALGAIPWQEGDELPEDTIRRLRDGE